MLVEELLVNEGVMLYFLENQRIEFGLDNGIKINFGKFGSGLPENCHE